MPLDEIIAGMHWFWDLLRHLGGTTTDRVWSLLGTTSYGYWFVPVMGGLVGWLRSPAKGSLKALIDALSDALAAVIIVFLLVFSLEFLKSCQAFWMPKFVLANPPILDILPKPYTPAFPVASNPPQPRSPSHTEPMPNIIVKFVNSTVRDTVGEISFTRVRIELEAKSAMQVIERQGIGFGPVDSDPMRQSAFENSLWAQVSTFKDVAPFQIRAHDDTIVLKMETDPLTAPQEAGLRAGLHFYFLLYVTDVKGRALLEFCLHKGIVGDADYCRSHNGP